MKIKVLLYLCSSLTVSVGVWGKNLHCMKTIKSSLVFILANDQPCAREALEAIENNEESAFKSQFFAYDEADRNILRQAYVTVSKGFRLKGDQRAEVISILDMDAPAVKVSQEEELPHAEAAEPLSTVSLSQEERWFAEKKNEACFTSFTGTWAVMAKTDGDRVDKEARFCSRKVGQLLESPGGRHFIQRSALESFWNKYTKFKNWTFRFEDGVSQTLGSFLNPLLIQIQEGQALTHQQMTMLARVLYTLKYGYVGSADHQGPVYEAITPHTPAEKEASQDDKQRLSLADSLRAVKLKQIAKPAPQLSFAQQLTQKKRNLKKTTPPQEGFHPFKVNEGPWVQELKAQHAKIMGKAREV